MSIAEHSWIGDWRRKTVATVTFAGGLLVLGRAAFANGEPRPWEIGMQPAASPVREHIDVLHNELLVIITLVALLVMALLIYVILRYNVRRNAVPSNTSHNALIEIIWTTVPVLVLLAIAIPSFKLLFYMGDAEAQHPGMTLKITAHQWYWTYEYPNQGDLTFDSNIIPDDELKRGQVRLLDVDNRAVVPVNTTIRLLVTSSDVIHSFFVPSLGVQEYAIPGRVNEAWTRIDKPGVYYGQCNQLCGINHAFMPIAVQAVSKADFAKWVEAARKKFAHSNSSPQPGRMRPRLAAAAG